MKFWELKQELQHRLIEIHLGHHGEIVKSFSSPDSNIYVLSRKHSSIELVAKTPKLDVSLSTEAIQARFGKFMHEIDNIYRACNHSLIQRFAYIEIVHGVPFLISRKRSMTLRDAMDGLPMAPVDALTVAIQICRALAYAAERGLVCHQDLKPENIFLDQIDEKYATEGRYPFKYQAYLADFDMANSAIIFGQPRGSRPYQAAEQYQRVSAESPTLPDYSKVDVFSLGVNLYEMLSGGIHPLGYRTLDLWPDSTVGNKWDTETPWKKWARSDAPLAAEDKIIDKEILDTIKDCLRTSPADRPSVVQLQARLTRKLRSMNTSAADCLDAYLRMLDEAAALDEAAGWPYMDELVSKVSKRFSPASSG